MTPKPQTTAAEGWRWNPDDAWDELLHKDDRNSPVEYPEMLLITFEELSDFLALHDAAPPPPSSAEGWRPIESAPRDGTCILGYWSWELPGEEYATIILAAEPNEHDPNYWWPLPPPPSAQSLEGDGEDEDLREELATRLLTVAVNACDMRPNNFTMEDALASRRRVLANTIDWLAVAGEAILALLPQPPHPRRVFIHSVR